MAAGSTVVFNARATSTTKYQWRRNGTDITGANSSALVLNNVTGASAGTYTVVAENAFGRTTSDPALLAVIDNAGEVGRLINLSILTAAGGCVIVPDGGPIRYGRVGDGYRNGPFAALGDPTLAADIVLRRGIACDLPVSAPRP